eukprot:TRINITY_DN7451_c0_g1_i2.p1 TRINITY_DN7451_c0_g1~~TRINITY_DN7451_c0_g1_i2.p1  ORF type:complete len:251 (+),score=27.94 TRINITY_DN7451_c0_g1_i2:58-810(+)
MHNDERLKRLAALTNDPKSAFTIRFFIVLTILFVILGGVLLFYSLGVQQVTLRYDNLSNCVGVKTCSLTINLENDISGPVFVYIRIDNFFQNHIEYLKSKDPSQAYGGSLSSADRCDPVRFNRDTGRSVSWNGSQLDPGAIANPCGYMAKSLFNDEFRIFDPSGHFVSVSTNGIAWPVDREKSRLAPDSNVSQWIKTTDERYLNWIRPSPGNVITKLWGRIERDLPAGKYTISIDLSKTETEKWMTVCRL